MKTYTFIDASNLFYGGEKSLGWKIDYRKLFQYLKKRYGVSRAFYFGGVETHEFKYHYLKEEGVSVKALNGYLTNLIKKEGKRFDDAALILVRRHLKRVRFYAKLEKFGYRLYLKPVKLYEQEDGIMKKKANCDVDMTFHLMKEMMHFDRVLVLSGDGDFLCVLKYLREQGKEVIILARGRRTAREIRQFAGSNFRDFVRLGKHIKFIEK